MMITSAEIDHRFTYHPPKDEGTLMRHQSVNAEMLRAAHILLAWVPQSRGLSLALTKLEEARMWANQAIAVEGAPEGD